MLQVTGRQGKVLALVVEKFIATGEPVGSKCVCDALDNSVSSATVRNEMAQLTALGLLEQPHTSAGRVPTQNGYRYYVDNLMGVYELSPQEQERIRLWLQAFSGDPDKLLRKAGDVLSELTDCAVVSGSSSSEDAVIRKVELLPLTRRSAMVVLLTSSGVLKSSVCRIDTEITLEIAEVFYNIIKSHFIGVHAAQIGTPYIQTLVAALGDKAFLMSPLLITVCELAASACKTDIQLLGQNRILGYSELSDHAGEIIGLLNSGAPLNRLISSQHRDLNVAIGSENMFRELHSSTTIFSKYSVGGHDSGVVGIIGPTRLDYAHLIPSIKYLTGLMGSLLSAALEDDEG